MENNEKAQKQLEGIGISARIENDCLYVCIDDTMLELSEFEVNFRASRFDNE